jgi:hypothetical protein
MENAVHVSKAYTRPMVLSHDSIQFETAQSWNRGHGNTKHPGTGNDGINYPLDPRYPKKNDK